MIKWETLFCSRDGYHYDFPDTCNHWFCLGLRGPSKYSLDMDISRTGFKAALFTFQGKTEVRWNWITPG